MMIGKIVSATFTATTVAIGTTNLGVTQPNQKPVAQAQMTFVCSPESQPPTMFAYTPGEVNLKPIMSWHSEYMLPNQSAKEICQQVATKLQTHYEQGDKKFLAAKKIGDRNVVCLVSHKEEQCNSKNSETLFSLNPNYDPVCLMNNRSPLECYARTVRGSVLSLPGGSYQPTWWPF